MSLPVWTVRWKHWTAGTFPGKIKYLKVQSLLLLTSLFRNHRNAIRWSSGCMKCENQHTRSQHRRRKSKVTVGNHVPTWTCALGWRQTPTAPYSWEPKLTHIIDDFPSVYHFQDAWRAFLELGRRKLAPDLVGTDTIWRWDGDTWIANLAQIWCSACSSKETCCWWGDICWVHAVGPPESWHMACVWFCGFGRMMCCWWIFHWSLVSFGTDEDWTECI